jgi:hypothetical protein
VDYKNLDEKNPQTKSLRLLPNGCDYQNEIKDFGKEIIG